MKHIRTFIPIALLVLLAITLYSAAQDSLQKTKPNERIGVYDSRSVAIAFAGSDAHKRWMAPLVEEHKKAKAAGDTERARELEAEGRARQRRAHTQGFATAPVDDILKHIEDQLPAIKTQAGVSLLVSKWDKETLKKHRAAEQVDVTPALIDAFNPSEKQRKAALEIQQKKPISIRQAEKIQD